MPNNTEINISGKLLQMVAKLVSYILHPLFIPVYFFLFLAYQFPYEFTVSMAFELKLKLISTFIMTAFFPAFAVFLLWRLNFIHSIFLKTQKERIIPFFITMFFYWWMYYLGRTMKDQPQMLKVFYFGIFISTAIGVIINNFIKISLHGIAMGSAMMAVILCSFFYHTPLTEAISIITVLTGIVCTARFIVSNHTNEEVYSGVFVGIICQIIAYWFVL
jgi:hypothetical protein